MEVRTYKLWGAYYIKVEVKEDGRPVLVPPLSGLVSLVTTICNLGESL